MFMSYKTTTMYLIMGARELSDIVVSQPAPVGEVGKDGILLYPCLLLQEELKTSKPAPMTIECIRMIFLGRISPLNIP